MLAPLSSLFEFEENDDAIRITTALLLPSGEYVTLYTRTLPGGGYEVTDNGETLHTLSHLGWEIPLQEVTELCNSLCVRVEGEIFRSVAETSIELARSILSTAQAISLVMWVTQMRNQ